MLGHFFMMSFNNGAMFVSLSAIGDTAADYYNTSDLGVEWFEQIFLAMTLISAQPVRCM
jgi:hypothetical protein